MSVSIHFPDEIEHALRRRASAVGQDIATFVTKIVTEQLADEPEVSARTESHAEYMTRVRDNIRRHGIHNGRFDAAVSRSTRDVVNESPARHQSVAATR